MYTDLTLVNGRITRVITQVVRQRLLATIKTDPTAIGNKRELMIRCIVFKKYFVKVNCLITLTKIQINKKILLL